MRMILLIAGVFMLNLAHAEIRVEKVEYKDGGQILEGMVAYDAKLAAKRPGVLVVHDWMGPGEYSERRIKEVAALGYTAFAADIYGKDLRPKNGEEASKAAGKFKSDRALLRRRAKLALDQLAKHKTVDGQRLAVMGYCFGGTTALELGRAGASVKGIISFHGGLSTPTPADAKNIKGQVLVLHGADDPFVPDTEVKAFEDEMRSAKVNWELVKYSKAVHAFTVPGAGDDPSKGAAYNAVADKRSWVAMKDFFAEIF